ncbi:hypothetical protein MRBBS_0902 [Marinobacter sp. BSs20148]|nr:hypothetical protein MRBBS_0902 [Marinobacter sp. BSs20148]
MQRFFNCVLHFHIGPVAIGSAKYLGLHFWNSTAKPDFLATVPMGTDPRLTHGVIGTL